MRVMRGVRCPECRRDCADDARACGHCGYPFDEDLADVVRHKTAPRFVFALLSFAALALLGTIVGLAAMYRTRSREGTRPSTTPAPEKVQDAVPTSAPSKMVEEWWVPPTTSKRQSVEVLAYDKFGSLDEHDLGAVFTEDLEQIANAPHFFEDQAPKVVHPNEADFHWLRTSGTTSADVGLHFFFVELGIQQSSTHDAVVFHSHEVTDSFSVIETTHMRRPPPAAVFYLAEVHRGTSVDFVIEGDYSNTGQRLGLTFQSVGASAATLQSTQRYQVRLRALGLKDFDGQGALAMSLADIKRSFRAEPATTELVFRTIPGRSFRPREIPLPKTIVDEPSLVLQEGETKGWSVGPGNYRFVGSSSPDGFGFRWSTSVTCTSSSSAQELRSVDTTCTTSEPATLYVSNPTTLGLGPAEHTSLYLAKLP
jgi:hypothetical protein